MLNRVLLIWRTQFGHYRQHPAQGLFLLIGLSLGVAILLGTLIVSSAAKSSFESAQKTVGGQIVATIRPINGQKTLPESTYVTLRRNGFTQIIPQVEGQVRLENTRFMSVLGIDIFALMQSSSGQPKNNDQGVDDGALSLLSFSFEPYQALVSQTLAKLHNLTNGDTIKLIDGQTLPIIKVVSNDFGSGYNLLCDLRCAQGLLSLPAQLTSIALTAHPDNIEQLKALLPADTALIFPRKNAENTALTDAFFLNITAVSFLAFLVGCFIAFNAVRFSVLQRMNMVQQLRLVGVTFSEIAFALLLELLTWAFLASIVGCLLGWIIAGFLLPAAGLTLAQLFQGKNLLMLGEISDWWSYALLISLIATATATVQPFWQLAKQQPLQSRTESASKSYLGYFGLVTLIAGGLLTLLPHSQTLGFVIAACWFIGGTLLVPGTLVLLYGWLSKSRKLLYYPKLQWAVADGKFNLNKMSVAMMAFTVAIAAGIAITTMVSSFRLALEDYLNQALSEDLYLMPDRAQVVDIKQFLDQREDVALAYRFYHTVTMLNTGNKSVKSGVRGLSNHKLRQNSISLEKQVDQLWPKFQQRKGILINQTLAFQQQLQVGDTVFLKVKDSEVEAQILGVFFSYGSTSSSLIIDQQWFKAIWPKVDTVEIGVFQQDDGNVDDLIGALKDNFQLKTHHSIKPQEMKALAMRIFKQTFQVTQLLIVFTLLIAAIGIYCACYSAQLDKQHQLTLLKVLGIKNSEIAGLSLLQLFFNAVVASLIAIPLGIIIAWASVHIVLQYSFGWHFAIVPQATMLVGIVASAIGIALLAGLIPLYSLSKKTVMSAFRESV